MSTSLVPLPTPGQKYSLEQRELVKRTLMPKGATDDELALFLGTANRMGLDPFVQQIRAIRRKEYNADTNRYDEKISIEPGIDGFRLVAQRTGEVEAKLGPYWCGPDGKWVDVWLPETPPAAAKFGVLRKGFREPVWAVALWREYRQLKRDGSLTRMWTDRPAGQLAKCSEALALRSTFPHELGGVYTTDEMAQADRDEPEAIISRFAVVEGGIPSEDTIRSLESVAAAKELVTREIVADRYREAVKVAEVDTFGEAWEDFWRAANLASWVEVLLAARLAVAPRAIEQMNESSRQPSDPAPSAPPRATGSEPEEGERAPNGERRDDPSSGTNASVTGPGPAQEPPSAEASTPAAPASPGAAGQRPGRRTRDATKGKGGEADPPPAGPNSDEAEQAAFEQDLAGDEPGRWTR